MAKVGLQLYTIKEETQKDFLGTLKKVAEMGYDGVEFAGYFGTEAAQLKAFLDEQGLEAAGTHIGIEDLEKDLNQVVEYAKAIQCQAVVCPGLFGRYAADRDAFLKAAKIFNEVGAKCKDNGMVFLYHVHGHEFHEFDGKTGMEILLDETDPALVNLELDTYWVERAGVDSVDFYVKHADRCPYLHFKDMNNKEEMRDIEVGEGAIDFKKIIAESAEYEMEWIVVEQEEFTIPPMESVVISLKNIREMLK